RRRPRAGVDQARLPRPRRRASLGRRQRAPGPAGRRPRPRAERRARRRGHAPDRGRHGDGVDPPRDTSRPHRGPARRPRPREARQPGIDRRGGGMTIAVGALVLALLERSERLRFRASPLWRAHAASDVIYLLTGYVAGGSLALAYVVATSHWLGRIGLPRLAAPRWASVPLALVALDLGNYAAHWLLHRVDVLWEFHKAHHSSPTLDWLATFRSHLVEQTLRRLVGPTLLIVAGVPPDAVVGAAALFTAWAMPNHSRRAPQRRRSAITVLNRAVRA